jgi:pyrimidine-specific ribonucleoside hydrolase
MTVGLDLPGLGGGRPIPVVVDCDPGIDDTVALAVIAASGEFDLRAVTTVRGNVPVDVCTDNARRALAVLGLPDVPVAAGAGRPLVRTVSAYPVIHGANGLGEVELPPVERRRDDAEPAVAVLERVLEAAGRREVVVVALGPLTNLATLLAMRPDLADRVALLAVMGATIGAGNITPFAEFNVWADPEAAYRVLAEGGLPTRLFTLAATAKANLDEPQRLLLAGWSATGASLAEMLLGFDPELKGDDWPLHDAMVVAGLLRPEILTLRNAALDIDTGTGPRRGASTFAWSPDPQEGTIEVAVDADAESFRELLEERISRL